MQHYSSQPSERTPGIPNPNLSDNIRFGELVSFNGLKGRIGILSGSFDPPHRGHIEVAQQALACHNLSLVVLLPHRGGYSDKPYGPIASNEDRYEMLRRAIHGQTGLVVSRFELDKPGTPFIIDSMREIRHAVDCGAELSFICGSDAVLCMSNWESLPEFLDTSSIIVVERAGYPIDHLTARDVPHFHDLATVQRTIDEVKRNLIRPEAPLTESSRRVRSHFSGAEGSSSDLIEDVQLYINERGLYRELPARIGVSPNSKNGFAIGDEVIFENRRRRFGSGLILGISEKPCALIRTNFETGCIYSNGEVHEISKDYLVDRVPGRGDLITLPFLGGRFLGRAGDQKADIVDIGSPLESKVVESLLRVHQRAIWMHRVSRDGPLNYIDQVHPWSTRFDGCQFTTPVPDSVFSAYLRGTTYIPQLRSGVNIFFLNAMAKLTSEQRSNAFDWGLSLEQLDLATRAMEGLHKKNNVKPMVEACREVLIDFHKAKFVAGASLLRIPELDPLSSTHRAQLLEIAEVGLSSLRGAVAEFRQNITAGKSDLAREREILASRVLVELNKSLDPYVEDFMCYELFREGGRVVQ